MNKKQKQFIIDALVVCSIVSSFFGTVYVLEGIYGVDKAVGITILLFLGIGAGVGLCIYYKKLGELKE